MEGEAVKQQAAIVFEATKVQPAPPQPGFAPIDTPADDDLVYPVPNSEPVLLKLSVSFNTRPFLVDGSVANAPATVLVDSGASASFVSLRWCKQHHITPTPLQTTGRLADQTSFNISGKLSRCTLKLQGFRV